jgi:hypothetical protein
MQLNGGTRGSHLATGLGDLTWSSVRSGAFGRLAASQQLYFEGASINSVWLALGSLSWHLDILDILMSLSKHLSHISIINSSS